VEGREKKRKKREGKKKKPSPHRLAVMSRVAQISLKGRGGEGKREEREKEERGERCDLHQSRFGQLAIVCMSRQTWERGGREGKKREKKRRPLPGRRKKEEEGGEFFLPFFLYRLLICRREKQRKRRKKGKKRGNVEGEVLPSLFQLSFSFSKWERKIKGKKWGGKAGRKYFFSLIFFFRCRYAGRERRKGKGKGVWGEKNSPSSIFSTRCERRRGRKKKKERGKEGGGKDDDSPHSKFRPASR